MLPKGFHWSVNARNARVQDMRVHQPYRGAFFSQVVTCLEDERVAVASNVGTKIINFAYPFASKNAWLRGQPEENTVILSILGSDSFDQQPVTYYDATKASVLSQYKSQLNSLRADPTATISDVTPYRPLTSGDIDQGSHFSQVFLGLKDVYQARGGLSHFSMTSQATSFDAPLFQVHGPLWRLSSAGLVDEVRFGVVRRPTSIEDATQRLIRDVRPSAQVPLKGSFAKEYSVILNSFGTLVTPNAGDPTEVGYKLIDHRQGVVVEDDGSMAQAVATQNNLRARFRWFTDLGETRAEVDQSGNWFFTAATDSLTGGSVVIPNGSLSVDVGNVGIGKITMRSASDFNVTSDLGTFSVDATTGFRVSTKAAGELTGDNSLVLRSNGIVSIESNAIIQLGGRKDTPSVPLPKYPLLIGNPTYLATLKAWLGFESSFDSIVGSYGATAAAAWSAVGALMATIDPSGATTTLCLNAAAAATATATLSGLTATALGTHMPTLEATPTGFVSLKSVSE